MLSYTWKYQSIIATDVQKVFLYVPQQYIEDVYFAAFFTANTGFISFQVFCTFSGQQKMHTCLMTIWTVARDVFTGRMSELWVETKSWPEIACCSGGSPKATDVLWQANPQQDLMLDI